ncbi:MAG: hypothetical protein NC935_03695 [Candidatus Omnitrophica bacterium]|nr:hypothetical protein [Candidatus Omnitrophota bacterium]
MELINIIFFIFIFLSFSIKLIFKKNNNIIFIYLLISILFFLFIEYKIIPILFLIIFFDYFFFLRGIKKSKSKAYLIGGVLFNILFLIYFKYVGFIVKIINLLSSRFSIPIPFIPEPSQYNITGISFFTFIATGCLIDLYKNTSLKPSFMQFALTVCFFPYVLAGPIVRLNDVIPQFKNLHKFNAKYFYMGLELLLHGYFKKCLVADNLASFVNPVFESPQQYGLLASWIASLFFTMQIYCDFSGYTDIARGCALLLGIKLPENFIWPYFSTSLREFWRRWHITLSFWVRDYIYIPLGGNKVSHPKHIFNLFVSWLIIGIWHGAQVNFILWGIYHSIFISLETLFKKRLLYANQTVRICITFFIVHIGWLLFRCENMSTFKNIIFNMVGCSSNSFLCGLGFYKGTPIFFLTLLPVLHFVSYKYIYNKNSHFLLLKMPLLFRTICILMSIIIIIIFSGQTQRFIYFAF